jgi:hypothetical protein
MPVAAGLMVKVAELTPEYGETAERFDQVVPLFVLNCHVYPRLVPVAFTEKEVLPPA